MPQWRWRVCSIENRRRLYEACVKDFFLSDVKAVGVISAATCGARLSMPFYPSDIEDPHLLRDLGGRLRGV